MLLLSRFKVIGHSMEPTINNNSSILLCGLPYWFKNPSVNDIVGFKINNKVLIKRVTKISNNKYFLQGDNKEDSLDSRKLGLISKDKILGKVIYKF